MNNFSTETIGNAGLIDNLEKCISVMEGFTLLLNKTAMEINHWVAKEVDTLIECVNHRGEETKELDDVTKNLLTRFFTMEDRVHVLEESVKKAAMVQSLSLEVECL